MMSDAKQDLAYRVESALGTARVYGFWPYELEILPLIKKSSLIALVSAWTDPQIEEWVGWVEKIKGPPERVPAPTHIQKLIQRAKGLAQ